jgi:SOS-response transcriptional repressor LexA
MNNLAERLQHAMDAGPNAPINASQLAERAGVTRATVSLLLSGQTQDPKANNLLNLADALGVRIEWLITGKGPVPNDGSGRYEVREPITHYGVGLEAGPEIVGKLPLISWVQAGDWANIVDPYEPGVADKWIPVPRRYSGRAYCLRVRGDSMQAPQGDSFPDGSIICVEPDRAPEHKNYVIVRLEDTKEATFKQLIIEGGESYLKPLNPRYPIMKIDGPATFCGVVRQMVMDF